MSQGRSKKALVLGGSRGIGAAIVKKLSAIGIEVAFTYNSSPEAATQLAEETQSRAVKADSADRDKVIEVVEAEGELDILVVNSGIGILGDPFEIKPSDIDRMIDINVRAPYHASITAAKQMREGGRIVLIGSVNGDRTPFAGGAAYSMTKSALQGMVRGLARDLGGRRITVNNVQPGPIDTDMNPADGPMKELMHSFMALKRHGRPEEVADFVGFLVGTEGDFITGAQLTIDGGFGA